MLIIMFSSSYDKENIADFLPDIFSIGNFIIAPWDPKIAKSGASYLRLLSLDIILALPHKGA